MELTELPLAIVDLETTGADPASDRITEIGVIEARFPAPGEDGEVSAEWSTLVNPQRAIPSAIQALTGITQAMVDAAPRFAELARELYERLDGRLFVAHNARFDYGFLRREFERAGLKFLARTLCTVKLSRRLYAEHARHNLDSLIERHGLACRARHRALGDADAVLQFLRVAAATHGAEVLAVAARQIAKQPSLPAHIDRALVDAIPEAPGVYFLYGEGGALLYVGKSVRMRSRVLQHFAGDLRSQQEMRLAREVRHIEWERTTGELGALLREAALVKSLAPAFNRRLQPARELCGFVLEGARVRLVEAAELDAESLQYLRGLFRSRRAALAALHALADAERLCLQALGFDRGSHAGRASALPRACFRHQLGRCAGVCAGKESVTAHHARVAAALGALKALAWPHRGPIGIVEQDREREATDVHVVHHWCHLGTARCDAELTELLEARRRPHFDYDQYTILARHLGKRGVRVVRLES